MQTNTMTAAQVMEFVKEAGLLYAVRPQFLEQGLGNNANLIVGDCPDTIRNLYPYQIY